MLTTIHTLLCFIAIGLGIFAIRGLFHPAAPQPWAGPFIIAAILATGTGFLFPFGGVTPAFGTGIVAIAILILVLLGRYAFGLAGRWRAIYAGGMVISLYLLVFVLIAQAFQKVPALNVLAPTGSEPPFAIAQLICLAVFVWIGWRAVRGARMTMAI